MKQYAGWQDIQTIQSKEIINELVDAKQHRRAKLLIAQTGNGKSHTLKLFQKVHKKNTFVVTVGDSYKMMDVCDDILEQMNVRIADARVRYKLAAIKEAVKSLDGKPIIIIDEAENLKPVTLRMVKELYDAIIDCSAIVLIGTDQILDTIFNKRKRNRQGVPQLWRRFKAGCRDITPLNKARDFKDFYATYIPDDTDLQALLITIAENYGELHDWLDPFLQYCSETNREVNEDNFRLFHKLPRTAKVRKMSA